MTSGREVLNSVWQVVPNSVEAFRAVNVAKTVGLKLVVPYHDTKVFKLGTKANETTATSADSFPVALNEI